MSSSVSVEDSFDDLSEMSLSFDGFTIQKRKKGIANFSRKQTNDVMFKVFLTKTVPGDPQAVIVLRPLSK